MLEYVKVILQKVSFDARLFEKELRKALASLLADEVEHLRVWCYEHYGKLYNSVLNRYFAAAC